MPAYDYRCLDCRKRFDKFMTYADYGKIPVVCPHCGCTSVRRRINRIRVLRSDESRLENIADPSHLEGLDQAPKSLGKMMRQMSGEIGEEMPEEFDEVVSRLEAGQSPEDIERDLPDLAQGGPDNFGGSAGLGVDDFD